MPKANSVRLGRGLNALLPNTDIIDEKSSRLIEVDPKLVKTNPYQPRLEFDRSALDELKSSLWTTQYSKLSGIIIGIWHVSCHSACPCSNT